MTTRGDAVTLADLSEDFYGVLAAGESKFGDIQIGKYNCLPSDHGTVPYKAPASTVSPGLPLDWDSNITADEVERLYPIKTARKDLEDFFKKQGSRPKPFTGLDSEKDCKIYCHSRGDDWHQLGYWKGWCGDYAYVTAPGINSTGMRSTSSGATWWSTRRNTPRPGGYCARDWRKTTRGLAH